MTAVYVASNVPYAGKTLTCVVLGTRWQRQGRRVGYIKPVGLLPVAAEDQVTDEDAQFVGQQLQLDVPPSQLCPVVLTREACHAEAEESRSRIEEAFAAVAAGKDVVLVNGLGSVLSRGSMLGIDGATLVNMLEARALLVARCRSFLDVDTIVASKRVLGDRLVGVCLNRVPTRAINEINDDVVPCLERHGIAVFGLLPQDPVLNSVTVTEVTEATGGELLCASESADELVENFVVGAMSVESALRYFRRTPRKCVITGGDRSDIQLAALETPTRCLVLTGGLRPSHTVLARAEELSVPVLLVYEDTLHTVSTVEELLGKLRLRGTKKIDHAVEQFEAHVDLAKLEDAVGLG
jgi:BioD-like phosphotransacetylase family protein